MTMQPGNDLAIELWEAGRNGLVFDFVKLHVEDPELHEPPDKALKVRMTAYQDRVDPVNFLKEDVITLDPNSDGDVIDYWREGREAYAGNGLAGVLEPPYDWQRSWPSGRAAITHRVRRISLTWPRELKVGTKVVLDWRTRLRGDDDQIVEGSLFAVYVEDHVLPLRPQEQLLAAPMPRVAHEPEPELRASEDIQGNILAGFKQDHQVFLFLNFNDAEQPRGMLPRLLGAIVEDPVRKLARGWLRQLIPEIATTKEVTEHNDSFKEVRERGTKREDLKKVWRNVGLTYQGICLLAPGEEAALQQFEAFRQGPGERAQLLGDDAANAPEHWEVGGPNRPVVHALLTVAADDVAALRVEVEKQLARAYSSGLKVVYQQRGDVLSGPSGGHEHFGFKEGVSQPGISGYTRPAAGRNEDREHPGSRIVAKELFLCGRKPVGWMENGSFQVFRRLAQDVPGWWAQLVYQTGNLPPRHQISPDQLAARLLGRWPSGAPFELAPVRDPQGLLAEDDFKFNAAADGLRTTPACAHIRKMNPREGPVDDTHRILRRGIPFGVVYDQTRGGEHAAGAERGLLFNAFIANIEQQFEFLQQRASNPDPDGPDPLIGVPRDGARCWISRSGGAPQEFKLWRHVRTTGAVYAFAPSIPGLWTLVGGRPEAPAPG